MDRATTRGPVVTLMRRPSTVEDGRRGAQARYVAAGYLQCRARISRRWHTKVDQYLALPTNLNTPAGETSTATGKQLVPQLARPGSKVRGILSNFELFDTECLTSLHSPECCWWIGNNLLVTSLLVDPAHRLGGRRNTSFRRAVILQAFQPPVRLRDPCTGRDDASTYSLATTAPIGGW